MDDLQTALQQLLADPQQLSELAAMASALGLHPPERGSPPPEKPAEPDAQTPPEPRRPEPLMPQGGRREKLLLALRPFLKPERQEKLDRALRIAQLTQLAGSALSGRDHR